MSNILSLRKNYKPMVHHLLDLKDKHFTKMQETKICVTTITPDSL